MAKPSWTPDRLNRLFELLDENYNNLFYRSISRFHRKLKKETFQKIANELNISFRTLKFKYFNLNNAYNLEVRKIEAAKAKGFFYRPTLPWFKQYQDVMEKVDELTLINEFDFDMYNAKEKESTRQEEGSDEDLQFEEEVAPRNTGGADTIVVSIKREFIDGDKKGCRDVDFEESPQTNIELAKEVVHQEPETEPAQISRIAYVKKPAKRPYKAEISEETIDEFQMFANHVAEQLRNMTIDSARKMQNEIHTIFDEEGFPFYSNVLDDMDF